MRPTERSWQDLSLKPLVTCNGIVVLKLLLSMRSQYQPLVNAAVIGNGPFYPQFP